MKENKVICFLGDSITEGVGASLPDKKYVEVFHEITGYEVRNYGVSGTRFARQKKLSSPASFDYDFQLRADMLIAMEKQVDYVFVFGGTNDFGHGDACLGEVGDTDPYTFCGGVNNVFDKLVSAYGSGRVCCILPLHRWNEKYEYGDGNKRFPSTLEEYRRLINTIIRKFNLASIDLWDNGLPAPQSYMADEYFTDGLHPNDKGHRIIAEKIAEYLKNRL